MSIDNFIESKINIKDLTIKSPDRFIDSSYDPKRDITTEDWKQIEITVHADPDILHWTAFLDPGRARVDNNLWKRMVRDAKNAANLTSEELFNKSTLMIVDRQKAQEEDILSEESWEELTQSFARNHNGNGLPNAWLSFQMASYARLIDPKKAGDFEVDEKHWNKIKEDIASHKRAGNLKDKARVLAEIKIAYPARMKEFGLSKDDWDSLKEGIKAKLNESRGDEEWYYFVWDAAALAILEAKEVKITETGVELVQEEPGIGTNITPDPLPERRKF